MSFAEQLARLQVFLDADDLHEEALDYIAAHGYLTALCICAEPVPEREWIDALFAEPPKYADDTEREAIEATLVQLKALNVTPGFVRSLERHGLHPRSADDLVKLKIGGLDDE